MRHPLWILNSTLLILLVVACGFFIVSRQEPPEWEDLSLGTVQPLQKKVSEINISKIYDYDLFDTYQRTEQGPKTPDYVVPIPPPPQPHQYTFPKNQSLTFLILLKSI